MFISYAQNCEDVVLWRALGHIENGTYVDVGAADPTEYSVTKAFYDRGWSGVNIEPAPEFVEKLRTERERDTTFPLCAGEVEGKITLHYVPGTGLSTVTDDHLEVIACNKFEVVDIEAEVKRLDAILDSAGLQGRDVHFLKVDVEGAEETVLRSIDLSAWRPWVMVVEATEPLSTAQTHHSWEPLLTNHGYTCCLFDGLNRFYVAAEHSELVAALSYPAGVFDQPYTVGTGQNELAARAEALVVERDELAESYAQLHTKYDDALSAFTTIQAEYESALSSYDDVERQLGAAVDSFARLETEHKDTLNGYQKLHDQYNSALTGYQKLHDEYDSTLDSYRRLERMYNDAVAALASVQSKLDAALDKISIEVQASEDLANQLQSANNRLSAIEASTSWKLTSPLRAIRRSPQP